MFGTFLDVKCMLFWPFFGEVVLVNDRAGKVRVFPCFLYVGTLKGIFWAL